MDFSTGTRTKFTYDLADRLVSQKEYTGTGQNGGTLISSTDFIYADKTNYLTGVKHFSPLGTQNIGYTYGDINKGEMPDQVYKVSWNGQEKLSYVYDPLGRLNTKTILVGGGVPDAPKLTTEYTYYDVGETKTTTLLKSLSTNGLTYNYTYDAVGNIQSIFDGGSTITYEYDELNQLVRVNDPYQNQTHTYEYENGNILFDHTYAYTEGELPASPISSEQYFYEDSVWGDVLTGKGWISYPNANTAVASVDESAEPTVGRELAPAAENDAGYALAKRLLGENIQSVDMSAKKLSGKPNRKISVYGANSTASGVLDDRINIVSDEIGNPIEIGEIQYRWNGRQLQGISIDGTEVLTYAYNTDGQRVRKEFSLPDEGLHYTYEYFYNGEILAGQRVTKIEGDQQTVDTLVFMYDNNGDVFGFLCNGEQYYYIKNAQNDVIMITDADGVAFALYQYDAWGNITFAYEAKGFNILELNPFTYRSYYYDAEWGMYYLNSRYYVPGLCRFLNADGMIGANQDINAYNLFAYCSNNPVNLYDPTGEVALESLFALLASASPWLWAIAAVAVVGSILLTVINTPTINDGLTTGIGNAIGAVNDTIDKAKERAREKAKAKEATTAIPRDKKPREPVIFPVNPLEFNPVGLIPVSREGTKNGSLISWMDPVTNTEIFRWDENPNYDNGPHYHVIGYPARHFEPGKDTVPEELAQIYFPR